MIGNDEITRLLAPLLLRPLRPAERLKIAVTFELLAQQQRELAAADQQIGHVVRRAALASAPRSPKGGRPKGSGARFVRIGRPISTERSWRVHVGRALWQELGEPKRLDIQRLGGALMLTPADGSAGYSLTRPKDGMPRLSIGQGTAEALGLEEGRFDAAIRGGAIVLG